MFKLSTLRTYAWSKLCTLLVNGSVCDALLNASGAVAVGISAYRAYILSFVMDGPQVTIFPFFMSINCSCYHTIMSMTYIERSAVTADISPSSASIVSMSVWAVFCRLTSTHVNSFTAGTMASRISEFWGSTARNSGRRPGGQATGQRNCGDHTLTARRGGARICMVGIDHIAVQT